MSPRPGELEVLTPLGDGGGEPVGPGIAPTTAPAARRGPRRRWPVLVLAAVIVAVVVAVPVRARLGRSELRWLERQWARSLADDTERTTAEQRLKGYSLVADETRINTAVASLYREEVQRFRSSRSRLGTALLVDPGLTAVRSDLVTALSHRGDLLAQVAAWYEHPADGSVPQNADDQTAGDTIRVDHALRAARTHWGETQPEASHQAAPYASANAALAGLARWFDHPLGISLLDVSGSQLLLLDIDASRSRPVDGIVTDGAVVARQGYLAYLSNGKIWAVAPDGSGAPRYLATGDNLFPAAAPDAIWVEDPTNLAVTEVDGSGRRLIGPISVPGQAIEATSKAFIVSPPDQPLSQIWDRTTRRVSCTLGGPVPPSPRALGAHSLAYLLATQGDLVVWVDTVPQLHVTDATTCKDRQVLSPPTQSQTPQGFGPVVAFSPDGRTLAVAGAPTTADDGAYPFSLIDLGSGRVTTVPVQTTLAVDAVAWTTDGTRLFWLSGGQFGQPPLIATWRVGDTRSQPLRVVGIDLGPQLLVVPK
ncbi:MAG: hypothetical protein QOF30_3116 [Acidimicrobiaceae bacterium]|nr:hypothetical protein [Acidimicrobiaceae bacterium]